MTASFPTSASLPRPAIRTGWVLSGLAILFLMFDATIKLIAIPDAVKATQDLGWPPEVLPALGILQVICLALYAIPRTAPIGAILWTGYLGGAIATHVRIASPLFTHILFPTYIAALLWGGLYLRDRRVRALVSR